MLKKRMIPKTAVRLLLLFWTFVSIFPIYWMITFSLKNNQEIFGDNVLGLPKYWIWENYQEALTVGNIGLYFANSIIVTGLTILPEIRIIATKYLPTV